MFQADCRAKGVQMTVEMGTSVQSLGQRRLLKGEWQGYFPDNTMSKFTGLSADPSRLAQTTVNLISNAQKFIIKSDTRRVRITIDISLDKPEQSEPILPPSEPPEELEAGTLLYLYIAVVSMLIRMTA